MECKYLGYKLASTGFFAPPLLLVVSITQRLDVHPIENTDHIDADCEQDKNEDEEGKKVALDDGREPLVLLLRELTLLPRFACKCERGVRGAHLTLFYPDEPIKMMFCLDVQKKQKTKTKKLWLRKSSSSISRFQAAAPAQATFQLTGAYNRRFRRRRSKMRRKRRAWRANARQAAAADDRRRLFRVGLARRILETQLHRQSGDRRTAAAAKPRYPLLQIFLVFCKRAARLQNQA